MVDVLVIVIVVVFFVGSAVFTRSCEHIIGGGNGDKPGPNHAADTDEVSIRPAASGECQETTTGGLPAPAVRERTPSGATRPAGPRTDGR
jgi:hypothetical protein